MNPCVRYALGLCLQVVGLLNFVFLVGVPIWLVGWRLCRDARTDDRSFPIVGRQLADGDSIHSRSNESSPSGDGRSSSTHPPESRPERHVPTRRN